MHLFDNSSKEDSELSEIHLDYHSLTYLYKADLPVTRKLGTVLFIHVSSFNFATRGMKPFYHLYSVHYSDF